MVTKAEYKKMLEELRMEYEEKRVELEKRVAIENNPYNEGDVITDHIGDGRILDKTRVYRGLDDMPMVVYLCANLTKSGSVNKREPERLIYQGNIKAK